jgi:hypothetical protein
MAKKKSPKAKEEIVEEIVEPTIIIAEEVPEIAEITLEQVRTLTRRQVRQILFMVRFGRPIDVPMAFFAPKLLEIINEQIDGQYSLVDFSHKWDIHPTDPLQVIVEFQWKMSGGGLDPTTGIKVPSAFTEQS